jgi:hypothetical protein
VFAFNINGSRGASLGSATTAPDGTFTVSLATIPAGAVEVVATGGTYVSERDGTTVTNTVSLSSLLKGPLSASGITGVVVTSLTDMVAARAKTLMTAGATLAAALSTADDLIKVTYGLTGLPGTIIPAFDKISIGTDGFTTGLVFGALDTCGKKLSPSDVTGLLKALSDDFSDGLFDGKKSGTPVTLGGGTLPFTAGSTDFLTCVSDYVASGKSLTDNGIVPGDLTATVTSLKTAVASSPAIPKAVGLTSGGSGAMTTMAFGGKQWLFIAARTKGVVAVDITDPTVASPVVKVFNMSAVFGATEVGGVAQLLGADHPQLLVFAYGSKRIALIDANTGFVDFQGNLPIVALSPVVFSGGSAFIAGAIPDTGRDGVWLATADGYAFFDRKTQTLASTASSGAPLPFTISLPYVLAENFGADVMHGLLFAPNYGRTVQLVDLTKEKSYYMDATAYAAKFSALSSPDAGSVDSGYQVGIITNEDSPDVGFINLKSITKIDATAGLSTFTPATDGTAYLKLGTFGPTLSGSAVDSDTHLALFMAGFSADIAVGQLQDPASVVSGSPWKGLTDWRFSTLSSYSIARDPHAVAVVHNLSNDKAYGYLLDGTNIKALQIDMSSYLAMAPVGTTGDSAHQPAGNPVTLGIIKSITWP